MTPLVETRTVVTPLPIRGAVVTPLADAANTVVTPLADSAEAVVTPLADSAEAVVTPLADAADTVVTPLADTVDTVVTPLADTAEPVVSPLAEAADALLMPVADATESLATPVIDATEAILAPADTLSEMTNAIAATTGAITAPVEGFTAPIIDVSDPITTPVLETVGAVTTPVAGATETITTTLTEALTGVALPPPTEIVDIVAMPPEEILETVGAVAASADGVDGVCLAVLRGQPASTGRLKSWLPRSRSFRNRYPVGRSGPSAADRDNTRHRISWRRRDRPWWTQSRRVDRVHQLPLDPVHRLGRGSADRAVLRRGNREAVRAGLASRASHRGRVVPSGRQSGGGMIDVIRDGFDRSVGRVGPDEDGESLRDSRMLAQLGMVLGIVYLSFLTVWFWATRLRWNPRKLT